ncbi:MAG: carbamoyltransferase HypF, partial [Thermoanaerobaculia bacterium]
MIKRFKLYLNGIIQGVGMRPFVFNLAKGLYLNGFVQNTPEGLNIEVEGEEENLKTFIEKLKIEKPSISYIYRFEVWEVEPEGYKSFEIVESEEKGKVETYILPDLATCKFCIEDIFDKGNRRYRYPFTNCTLCGPRFSIIKKLPYDRKNTTMSEFKMCKECQGEYDDPSDRRFHAQPNACPECGPKVFFCSKEGKFLLEGEEALLEAEEYIKKGKIVGVKGLGGFHIVCSARNDKAVALLRERKGRKEKPFALMYPSIEEIERDCFLDEKEKEILQSPQAPIVLLKNKDIFSISPLVAPRNQYLGVMLPYTPLHHILLSDLKCPIVATSGNLSEEPIITDENYAFEKLKDLCDGFLIHNRKIERHIDDSIVRIMASKEVVLRRARGYVPFPFITDKKNNSVGFGGFLKANISFQKGKNIFVSQHIGDLETEGSFEVYKKIYKDFTNLFKIKPEKGSHDLHPDFPSTQFALSQKLKMLPLQHHIAHLFSCMEDNGIKPPLFASIWDGTGLGDDKKIW